MKRLLKAAIEYEKSRAPHRTTGTHFNPGKVKAMATQLYQAERKSQVHIHQPESDVARYLRLLDEKRVLEQEARQIGKDIDAIRAACFEILDLEDGPFTEDGFLVSEEGKDGRVAWKAAFIDVAGEAAAAERIADAPKRRALVVEPV